MVKDNPDIKLRALYEHYKSTPEDRKSYVTLGVVAIDDQVYVQYIADYDPTVVYLRDIDEFYGIAKVKQGQKIARFTLIDENVISGHERDYLLDELPQEYA